MSRTCDFWKINSGAITAWQFIAKPLFSHCTHSTVIALKHVLHQITAITAREPSKKPPLGINIYIYIYISAPTGNLAEPHLDSCTGTFWCTSNFCTRTVQNLTHCTGTLPDPLGTLSELPGLSPGLYTKTFRNLTSVSAPEPSVPSGTLPGTCCWSCTGSQWS